MTAILLPNVTCIAIEGRGVLIEGPPGSGKSSLALALIDRGAALVGDDGIRVSLSGPRAIAAPPPEIGGLLEIRGVGIVSTPAVTAPLCLVLALGLAAERMPAPAEVVRAGASLPLLPLVHDAMAALRAEWALRVHGLPGL